MASWVFDDGGRAAAGFKGAAGDCVARSVAIASGRPYGEVYTNLATIEGGRIKRGKQRAASARNGVGVRREAYKRFMRELGFEWTPTMQIGSGCKVHLRADELPNGRLVVHTSRHSTAVIDGVIHDTYDPSRGGNRCVYGYWKLADPLSSYMVDIDGEMA
jgi:hypothetical protein